ncbi:phospholipase D-like domain-containing protein [Legionella bononiensis]|uniref:Phosphatidylserine/phosphatidylglycerophosphate/ cardiolipin synthase family protein n=1 Tax=Legionella bononiensis TaxID=2793102 RepID=A0ABS1WAP7_9GAMM|nr:phosphatidylserine/phosphatidylglycerophosphate/cardiolipin synthase family protein [Legionella bononiensis]MBL7480340.1 phosphatidylserine/phosphatidylglycerophosphate/cardiolipin synthase family protein [Legionella bononiensis]MBL7526428.1 phosphatidylserine/phosphatidylglycerophosphate/cardiolipin synthase family protein [Legionella bononiensis]MBL7563078.1 phosphatidylserine/phosphatidylglycerophosphate/cardiolipin synthase family protein [Legionella bononiensis]
MKEIHIDSKKVVNQISLSQIKPSPLMSSIIASSQSVAELGTIPANEMLMSHRHEEIEIAQGIEEITDLIVNKIRDANEQLVIQIFVWEPDTPIIEAINQALCDREKPLQVYILLDELGMIARMFYLKQIFANYRNTTEHLGLHDLPEHITVHLGTYTHSSPASNHAKTICIDDDVILTSSNFQSASYGEHGFHDTAIFIPKAARPALLDFLVMWRARTDGYKGDEEPKIYEPSPISSGACPMLYITSQIRVKPATLGFFQAALPPDPINNAYMTAINQAQSHIQIIMPNVNSPEILRALLNFINNKNGKVDLLMSYNFNDLREFFYGGTNQESVNQLYEGVHKDKKKNLTMQWFNQSEKLDYPIKDVIHMKLMIIDGQVTIVGSTNLDLAGLHNCHETNVVIDSKDFAQRMCNTLFLPNFEHSTEAEVDFEPFRVC